MARLSARDRPERERRLSPAREVCPDCGQRMRIRYENCRNLVTLSGMVRLRLRIRRCETPDCLRFHRPYRPEAEGALALPHHEFGLDVVALVGVLRHRDHRSVPEIHALLRRRGLEIAERILGNAVGEDVGTVRRRFDGLIGSMARHCTEAGSLIGAVAHFLKVTRSYRSGLFHCYAVVGLPRTNNDLEQLFGSQRYHERRATGRKTASPALVLRGEVRVIAAVATRMHPPTARDLGRVSRERWRALRQRLDRRIASPENAPGQNAHCLTTLLPTRVAASA